ncbi:hypothetical protein KUL152_30660 [Tenacibaculum sp. KUL152]|nr:hypothetical protein KUL152_30660 [Tenacibaculum sp. KUL152]
MSSGSGELPSITTASVPLGKLMYLGVEDLNCSLVIDIGVQAVSAKLATTTFDKIFMGTLRIVDSITYH